jgi:hypothetical protein
MSGICSRRLLCMHALKSGLFGMTRGTGNWLTDGNESVYVNAWETACSGRCKSSRPGSGTFSWLRRDLDQLRALLLAAGEIFNHLTRNVVLC